MQLQRDFEYVVEYVCSKEASLRADVTRKISHLPAVQRSKWIATTLQRTDNPDPNSNGQRNGYEYKTRRRTTFGTVLVLLLIN